MAATIKTGGDDLDDGLELDPNLLASSDVDRSDGEDSEDEDGAQFEAGGSGSNSLYEDLVIADQDLDGEDGKDGAYEDGEETNLEAGGDGPGSRKRKVETEDVDDVEAKKRRKKEKEKERRARKQQQKVTASIDNPPTHYSTSEISALLLKSIRESFRSASTMEIDDLIITDERLLPPAEYPPPPKGDNPFEPLVSRLDSLLKPLQKQKLKPSTPRVIILALSGLRCADLVREVRAVKGGGEVAKLFAKHFKTVDQAKYLAKTKVSIAVGTPGRVGKLLSEDAIKISKDTVLLLEVSHQDCKTRTLLNLPEVRDELWKSVFSGPAREKLFSGGARVGLF